MVYERRVGESTPTELWSQSIELVRGNVECV